MEEMALREQAQRAVSNSKDCRSNSNPGGQAEQAEADAAEQQLRAQAEQQNKLLNAKIQLDASRKEQRAKQALQSEAEQRRLETIAGLGVGEMELRELVFDSQISVDGYDGSWEMWMLFGGRREGIWTTYLAEPVVPAVAVSFARASLPLLWVQVVDFAAPFYSTAQGIRRIELLVVEIQKVIGVRHRNLATVYAVKREHSPKGWERIVILVEKAEDGGRLKGFLMRGGLGEEVAKVRKK
jgi:translation initiation factor 2-alpha kinase 4